MFWIKCHFSLVMTKIVFIAYVHMKNSYSLKTETLFYSNFAALTRSTLSWLAHFVYLNKLILFIQYLMISLHNKFFLIQHNQPKNVALWIASCWFKNSIIFTMRDKVLYSNSQFVFFSISLTFFPHLSNMLLMLVYITAFQPLANESKMSKKGKMICLLCVFFHLFSFTSLACYCYHYRHCRLRDEMLMMMLFISNSEM